MCRHSAIQYLPLRPSSAAEYNSTVPCNRCGYKLKAVQLHSGYKDRQKNNYNSLPIYKKC